MNSCVDVAREALDSLGVKFRELPGSRFVRFVTETISNYAGISFYVLVSERYEIVKIVAFSPDLHADDASGPYQGTVVPRDDGSRRVVHGLLVGWRTLHQPQTVESVVAEFETAARALIGDQSDLAGLRERPGVARRASSDERDEVSVDLHGSLHN